jgi:hypothetical protein
MTTEAPVFTLLGWRFASHDTVAHKKDEYARGDAYTNTVEEFFSILKRGIYGVTSTSAKLTCSGI